MRVSTWALLASVNGADAFWRMICNKPITTARLDPIISPGSVSMHTHSITGPSSFDQSSTFESLRAADCTTCTVQEDRSAYWVPQLYYVRSDGQYQAVKQVGGVTVYYLQRGTPNADGKYRAFPAGLHMIAGNPFRRSYDASDIEQEQIGFSCLGGTGYTKTLQGMSNCPNGLRAEIFFPNCWDGVNLDSPDHKSHMAYSGKDGNGACPSSHPVKLISIFFEAMWDINAFAGGWWNGTSAPFVFAQGDPTGYGSHGDFLSGWNESFLQSAIDTCTNNSGRLEDCPVFNLQYDVAAKCSWTGTSLIQENVFGPRATLPGCNPISFGPLAAPVKPLSCPDGSLVVLPSAASTPVVQLPTHGVLAPITSAVGGIVGGLLPVGFAAQQSSAPARSAPSGSAANAAVATALSSSSSASARWSNSSIAGSATGNGARLAAPATVTTIQPTVYTTVLQGQTVVSTSYITIALGSQPAAATAAPAGQAAGFVAVAGSGSSADVNGNSNGASGNSDVPAVAAAAPAAGDGDDNVRTVVETIYATVTRTAYSTQTLTLGNGQATTTVSQYVQLFVLPSSLTSMLTQQRVVTTTVGGAAGNAAVAPTVTSTIYQTTTRTVTPGAASDTPASASASAAPSMLPANGTFVNGTLLGNNNGTRQVNVTLGRLLVR